MQQVDQAARLSTISSLAARANREVEAEDWDAAAATYQKILDQDANVAAARDGLGNARARIALRNEMQKYIEDPDRLADADEMNAAASLMTRIARIAPQGPKLKASKEALARVLKRAASPVPVRLVSDSATDVAVYKVGRLGKFDSTELELRPGVYTAVGSRPGFKDVRRQFRVSPDAAMDPVVVQCEEPI